MVEVGREVVKHRDQINDSERRLQEDARKGLEKSHASTAKNTLVFDNSLIQENAGGLDKSLLTAVEGVERFAKRAVELTQRLANLNLCEKNEVLASLDNPENAKNQYAANAEKDNIALVNKALLG